MRASRKNDPGESVIGSCRLPVRRNAGRHRNGLTTAPTDCPASAGASRSIHSLAENCSEFTPLPLSPRRTSYGPGSCGGPTVAMVVLPMRGRLSNPNIAWNRHVTPSSPHSQSRTIAPSKADVSTLSEAPHNHGPLPLPPAAPSTSSRRSTGVPPCQWRELIDHASGPLPPDLTASPPTATLQCWNPSCRSPRISGLFFAHLCKLTLAGSVPGKWDGSGGRRIHASTELRDLI